jgi:GDP-D-mannose dehydratase
MLPYKPEHIADLKRRFPMALQMVVDCTVEPVTYVPGKKPEHIFDCVDGIRVIASRDKMRTKGGGEAIFYHFSTSAMYGTVLSSKVRAGRIKGDQFKRMSELRFQELTGLRIRPADHFTVTKAECFHWFWKETYPDSVDAERNLA